MFSQFRSKVSEAATRLVDGILDKVESIIDSRLVTQAKKFKTYFHLTTEYNPYPLDAKHQEARDSLIDDYNDAIDRLISYIDSRETFDASFENDTSPELIKTYYLNKYLKLSSNDKAAVPSPAQQELIRVHSSGLYFLNLIIKIVEENHGKKLEEIAQLEAQLQDALTDYEQTFSENFLGMAVPDYEDYESAYVSLQTNFNDSKKTVDNITIYLLNQSWMFHEGMTNFHDKYQPILRCCNEYDALKISLSAALSSEDNESSTWNTVVTLIWRLNDYTTSAKTINGNLDNNYYNKIEMERSLNNLNVSHKAATIEYNSSHPASLKEKMALCHAKKEAIKDITLGFNSIINYAEEHTHTIERYLEGCRQHLLNTFYYHLASQRLNEFEKKFQDLHEEFGSLDKKFNLCSKYIEHEETEMKKAQKATSDIKSKFTFSPHHFKDIEVAIKGENLNAFIPLDALNNQFNALIKKIQDNQAIVTNQFHELNAPIAHIEESDVIKFPANLLLQLNKLRTSLENGSEKIASLPNDLHIENLQNSTLSKLKTTLNDSLLTEITADLDRLNQQNLQFGHALYQHDLQAKDQDSAYKTPAAIKVYLLIHQCNQYLAYAENEINQLKIKYGLPTFNALKDHMGTRILFLANQETKLSKLIFKHKIMTDAKAILLGDPSQIEKNMALYENRITAFTDFWTKPYPVAGGQNEPAAIRQNKQSPLAILSQRRDSGLVEFFLAVACILTFGIGFATFWEVKGKTSVKGLFSTANIPLPRMDDSSVPQHAASPAA